MKIIQKIKNIVFWPKKELNWWIENWKTSSNFRKRFVAVVLGFGLAGILWGLEAFNWLANNEDNFTNPFLFDLGAISFGILGGLALIIFSKDISKKKILKIISWGTLGWIVAFLLPVIFIDWMLVFGSVIVFVFVILEIFIPHQVIIRSLILEPSLRVGHLWAEFLFTGLIIGLFYALILKLKCKSMVYRTGIGFALAALISPVIGNLIGNYLLNSLLSAYTITFALIGVIFGLSLFSGIKKSGERKK